MNEAFESAKGNNKALNHLLQRIWNIKLFDPACGSGNFLIIAYKELRKLEMKIFKALGSLAFSNINLSNFYGIEIDDFAHEIATLSLWLAEHQMNQEFFKEFGRTKPALPLQETGNIVQGNSIRLNWETICPKSEGDEVYILGNPPYLGSSMQSVEQKEDLAMVCKGFENYKNLDYISCWFLKGAKYITNSNCQYAFVTTNSICQGEQVALLWPHIFSQNAEISFAYSSFKWDNSAKANAGVTCTIIGVRNNSSKNCYLYHNNLRKKVQRINAYLTEGNNTFIYRRSTSLSGLPLMLMGNKPTDGGHLILELSEKESLLSKYPDSKKFIKKLIGSDEFINGYQRWCLWINDSELIEASTIEPIKKRIQDVAYTRSISNAKSTRNFSGGNHRFIQVQHEPTDALVFPEVSSERRDYIPIGFCDSNSVLTNKMFGIYNAEYYIFSILTSRMHMVWSKATCGRLETRISYSSVLCYNSFPFPSITEIQKAELEKYVYRIFEERENNSEKTLAKLYDPTNTPQGLREAHTQNDLAVERLYRSKPFETDEERLEYLFKLYEQMIEEEQTKGTLFEVEKKRQNRRLK